MSSGARSAEPTVKLVLGIIPKTLHGADSLFLRRTSSMPAETDLAHKLDGRPEQLWTCSEVPWIKSDLLTKATNTVDLIA